MQVWDSVKVKESAKNNVGEAGVIQAIKGDVVTVKLDLEDAPKDFDIADLQQL